MLYRNVKGGEEIEIICDTDIPAGSKITLLTRQKKGSTLRIYFKVTLVEVPPTCVKIIHHTKKQRRLQQKTEVDPK